MQIEPNSLIQPRRKITGISAILLPFDGHGEVDWAGFDAHVVRTAAAGLVPAVNMDTGYVNLIDDKTRIEVLRRTREVLGNQDFAAGAFVGDNPESKWNPDAYRKQIEYITKNGGMPVIFQSYGLTNLAEPEIVAAYAALARECDGFIAFELGKMFAPFGKIYSLETFAEIMALPQCVRRQAFFPRPQSGVAAADFTQRKKAGF